MLNEKIVIEWLKKIKESDDVAREVDQIIQILTDPENQPHQFLAK